MKEIEDVVTYFYEDGIEYYNVSSYYASSEFFFDGIYYTVHTTNQNPRTS